MNKGLFGFSRKIPRESGLLLLASFELTRPIDSVEFDYLPNDILAYRFVFNALTASSSSNSTILLEFTADGGGVYDTAADYGTGAWTWRNGGNNLTLNSNANTALPIGFIDDDVGFCACGRLLIATPEAGYATVTGYVFSRPSSHPGGNTPEAQIIGSSWRSNSRAKGFRIRPSTGNFTGGYFRVYGLNRGGIV